MVIRLIVLGFLYFVVAGIVRGVARDQYHWDSDDAVVAGVAWPIVAPIWLGWNLSCAPRFLYDWLGDLHSKKEPKLPKMKIHR